MLLAGTIGELVDAYNVRDNPVINIIVSCQVGHSAVQWVRLEIGLLISNDRKKKKE